MKELIEMADKVQAYVNAVDTGFNKFLQVLPDMVKQHLKLLAQRNLNTTREAYVDAIRSEMSQYLLVVNLDQDSWLANAVEQGVGAFSLKDGHLKSPKARISKAGFRYMYIPLGITKSQTTTPDNQLALNFQQRIRDVLQRPKFGMKRLKQTIDGKVSTMEEVQVQDPDLSGIYRVTTFASAQAYATGKKGTTQFLMFRTMSDKPGTSVWEHPGIAPKNLFRELNMFVGATAGKLLESMINDEIAKITR